MVNKYRDEFVVYKGETYRAKSYSKEYELFHIDDISKENPLMRIPREDIDYHYEQFADCDIGGIRYSVVALEDGYCYYKRYTSCKTISKKSVGKINEIWLQRNHSQKRIVIETLWHNPNCAEKPSQNRFYVEEMVREGYVMTSHIEELLNYEKTLELMQGLYGERMSITSRGLEFWDGTPFCTVKIDEQEFDVTTNIYEIVCISPKQTGGNPYIYEIVEALNKAENSP